MDIAKLNAALREMILLASRLRNNLNEQDPFAWLTDEQNEAAENAIDDAWELFEDADAELQAADADQGFTPYRVDFRSKFVRELETWIDDQGFDDALTLFGNFLQQQIDEGADDDAIRSMQSAWEEAAGVVGPEPDYEAQADERERREYEAGKAEGELRRAERKIYGDKLAEQFHAQDDLNAYNRGEE